MKRLILPIIMVIAITSCETPMEPETKTTIYSLDLFDWSSTPSTPLHRAQHKYTPVKLETDLSMLSENQKKMIKILIEASEIMDDLFWYDVLQSDLDHLADAGILVDIVFDQGLAAWAS